jgi:hypothetical protein
VQKALYTGVSPDDLHQDFHGQGRSVIAISLPARFTSHRRNNVIGIATFLLYFLMLFPLYSRTIPPLVQTEFSIGP